MKYRFKLSQGEGFTTIETNFALQLNTWHNIEAYIDIVGRGEALGTLIVNGINIFTLRATGVSTNLYSNLLQESVYIGGGSSADAIIM